MMATCIEPLNRESVCRLWEVIREPAITEGAADGFRACIGGAQRLLVAGDRDAASLVLQAVLSSLLVVAWRAECGRPTAQPQPSKCPEKLFTRGAIDKPALKRLRAALDPASPIELQLNVCRDLLAYCCAGKR